MAILDFIKNRQQQAAKPAQARAPQTALTTPAKQDVSKVVPASELAKAREIGERLKKASMQVQTGKSAEQTGGNAALLQNQNNQDKVQPAMSPTDRFAGKTALQGKGRGWER
jgi:hypothetical protein